MTILHIGPTIVTESFETKDHAFHSINFNDPDAIRKIRADLVFVHGSVNKYYYDHILMPVILGTNGKIIEVGK